MTLVYTRAELLDHLRTLALEYGRTPGVFLINQVPGPCADTYYTRFGSLCRAQRLAGLIPNRPAFAGSRAPSLVEREVHTVEYEAPEPRSLDEDLDRSTGDRLVDGYALLDDGSGG